MDHHRILPSVWQIYSWLRSIGLTSIGLPKACSLPKFLKMDQWEVKIFPSGFIYQSRDGQGYLYQRRTKLLSVIAMANAKALFLSTNQSEHSNVPRVICHLSFRTASNFQWTLPKTSNPKSTWNERFSDATMDSDHVEQFANAWSLTTTSTKSSLCQRTKAGFHLVITFVIPRNENIKRQIQIKELIQTSFQCTRTFPMDCIRKVWWANTFPNVKCRS